MRTNPLPRLGEDLILWNDRYFSCILHSSKDSPHDGFKPLREEEKKDAEDLGNEDNEVLSTKEPRVNQEKDVNVNNTNNINVVSPTTNAANTKDNPVDENIVYGCANDPNMPNFATEDQPQVEPKKVIQALTYPKWIESMQDELLQFKLQNKSRLVAQGYTQEERIDYDEVFAPVARIETIRLFLAYASFKNFVVYQMDVKSAFLYGKIEKEVYVYQPPGFEDLEFPGRVYKVEKALYGLHQAPKAPTTASPSHIIPILTVASSSQPKKTQKHKKTKIKATEISQSIRPTTLVADKTVHEERRDRVEMAATTNSSLEAKQDSGGYIQPGGNDQDEGISFVQEHVEIQGKYGHDAEINTASISITTTSINITTAELVTTVSTPITTVGVSVSTTEPTQLQAELEEGEGLARQKEEEANIALIAEWDDLQAMMHADHELAERLQAEEQRESTIEERSKLFVELVNEKEKAFLKDRAEGSETRVEGSSKRIGEELESDKSKKQKLNEKVEAEVDNDQEEAKIRMYMKIVSDDEVAINAIPLATKPPIIVEWKIIKEGKITSYHIIRVDGSSKRRGIGKSVWGDLKVMFEPDIESEV
nr:retrovirus-related Pol polyprotein from transposon TNT 1-94 [Tanacetum cinerariifolium]